MASDPGRAFSRRVVYIPLALTFSLLLGSFILLDLYFGMHIEKNHIARLTVLARSGVQMLEYVQGEQEIEDYDRLADAFARNSRLRVSIFDEDGLLMGDSAFFSDDIRAMANKGEHPEIKAASNYGLGISKRQSSKFHAASLFVAVQYNMKSYKGYFRVAEPIQDLLLQRQNQRILFGTCSIVILIITGLFSLIASRHLRALVAMGQNSLEEQVSKRTGEIRNLQRIITQLTVCRSLSEVAEVITLGAAKLLPHHTGALALFRSSKDQLEIAAVWQGEWQGEPCYKPDQCWALRTGQPYEGCPAQGNISCAHATLGQDNMRCIPIVAQGEIYGVFHFSCMENRPWYPEERQLAAAIAEHASLTMASLDLRESLRQQAIRDPLTGLYNRRYLLELLNHEISRASRRKKTLGVLMIDIDHFKQFNDDHGHDIGDFILSEFGNILRNTIRKEDTSCRYGGEEFTILLPDMDAEGVVMVAEKIRTAVRKHDYLRNNIMYGPITISLGCALYPEHAAIPDGILKCADRALYRSKETGRDKVMMFEGSTLE